MKTEPDVFSFEDLQNRPQQREHWDGVRNYLARNFMTKEMRVGHKVLFYHSNADPSGIAGTAEIVGEAVPDPSAWNPQSPYFDPTSQQSSPKWYMVVVGKPQPLQRFLPLEELRKYSELQNMLLLQKGQRLSIMPVSKEQYEFIVTLGS